MKSWLNRMGAAGDGAKGVYSVPMKHPFEINSAFGRISAGFRAYVWLFAVLFFLYLTISPFVALKGSSDSPWPATRPYSGDANVKFFLALVLAALAGAALFLHVRGRLPAGRAGLFFLAAGMVLRFGYMLYTPFYVRGHDITTYTDYGHLAYIRRLYDMQSLPASYAGQFYHPPLAHMAAAAVARLHALITGPANLDTHFEAARLVPCFASCALLLMSGRLLDELCFKPRAKITALAVIAFHPTFIILSASINNDMLMVFFFMAAFLYTVRWHKDPSRKNILLLALFIGAAMSTKFSGGMIAVYTAAVFIAALLRRRKDGPELVFQFALFALVCLPLGLWYHIRNLRLFGQPIGYVPVLTPDSALYVGDKTFSERFLAFSLPDMFQNVFCNPYKDYRLWEYTVKCALFGEFTFSLRHRFFAGLLIVSSLILILLSLVAMVRFLFFNGRRRRFAVLSFGFIWIILMVSFVMFNIRYPYGCTMDFRYIVPTVISGAAFLGLLSEALTGGKVKDVLFAAFRAVLAVFCASSAIFFVV